MSKDRGAHGHEKDSGFYSVWDGSYCRVLSPGDRKSDVGFNMTLAAAWKTDWQEEGEAQIGPQSPGREKAVAWLGFSTGLSPGPGAGSEDRLGLMSGLPSGLGSEVCLERILRVMLGLGRCGGLTKHEFPS